MLAWIISSIALAPAPAADPMIDPAIDDPAKEWCYLSKSTTVIGVPYQPDAVQVTFDGAIYTTFAELAFFYGDRLEPLLARQKSYLDGWIPIVVHAWRDASIAYDIEIFGAVLDGESESNTIQFARVRLRNDGTAPARAVFAAALRHSGGDHRFGASPFSPSWRYEMTGDAAIRDEKLVYTFPPGARREAAPGVPYTEPFAGSRHAITERAEACLARYERMLAPGEEEILVFKMPRVPVPISNVSLIEKIRTAHVDVQGESTILFWKDLLGRGAEFEIPEPRVDRAWRASLVHLILATRERNGERFQTSGLLYPNFFIIDFVDMRMAYDALGHHEFARDSFPQILKRQLEDGLFCDTSLSHGQRLWSSHGHMVHSIAHHFLMTRDWTEARRLWPHLRRAIEWIRAARAADGYGLMPPAWPYDAEMIQGRYTSHNLWCLLGLRSAVRLARELGEADDARAWREIHDDYEETLLRALRASARDDGAVPTGLHTFLTGEAARKGFKEYQTDQEWENILLVYPTEVLTPDDKRVTATLDRMHRLKYREGIMTYRNGMHLHQYLTTNVTQQHIARGDQEQALADLYHILLHSGSTHEGFENMVVPWRDRDAGSFPPPHAWAAAKIALLVRTLLVTERGGRAGLDAGARDLHLFSVLSPAWVSPGKRVVIRDAPTEMGPISAVLGFTDAGAGLSIRSRFHSPPRSIIVHIPYFVELTGFRSDARTARVEGRAIVLSPDVSRCTLDWRPREGAHRGTFEKLLLAYRREPSFRMVGGEGEVLPPADPWILDSEKRGNAPLTFDLVVEAFRHEFARRHGEHVAKGGGTVTVEAPRAMTPSERGSAFRSDFGPTDPDPGIAVGKPVTASSAIEGHSPEHAADGRLDLNPSWWADPYPQWFRIDLERVARIDRIHVFTYWGLDRYYRYTVEVSEDGEHWTRVADRSLNAVPSTPKGDDHRFAPIGARYIRVNMLFHSLNPGVHLVEVKVFVAR